ncbi:predicted protein [Nematostella vectensis]|uniref:BSD domain-containing protein n=1 Tax=Nematostella vectensis TaxID=45351 RepID=A7RH50_NEMVE|nr:predicted protein [Nematostella vectensis]|eukprot:XP_001641355.1 predicted protein [Nematostella vectensis]
MAAVSESSVLLTVINTKYKKNSGVLQLLTNNLTWSPQGSSAPKIDCKYSEIKVQRISPEGSSKVQLQVVLHDNSSYSIHFTGQNAKKERDDVKELLAQLIPAHRKKASKELEEKNRMLKDNPELYQLYKDLVVSGVITPDEFWANRGQDTGATSKSTGVNQSIGLSSALLADMQPESSGCNEVKYSLNADTIETIFRTYPAVKKKHEEVVPDQMTEKDFWTKFFQSHYFHRDRSAETRPTASDMFTECAKQDEKEQLASKLNLISDPMLDLKGYGSVPCDVPEQVSKNSTSTQSLFRRLNHHSLMVLHSTPSASTTSDGIPNEERNGTVDNQPAEPPAKKTRLREVTEYDDLQEHSPIEPISLKIVTRNKYSGGPVTLPGINGNTSIPGHNAADVTTAIQYCQHEVNSWTPDLTQALSSDQACHVLTEISPGGSLMETTSQANIHHTLSSTMKSEVLQQYMALTELLRHFWSCFPVKTAFLEEKVARMGQSLEKYRNTKLEQLRGKLSEGDLHLIEHLTEMLEAATAKYRSWEGLRAAKITR